jgi:hypothetical protein
MEQLGQTDPKLALRIDTRALGDRRRRGKGARLVSVLADARWALSPEGKGDARRLG